MDSIFHRRSIRAYEDKPVEEEKIEQILKAAMNAPTACGDKQWEFYVVTNPELKNRLANTSPYAHCAAKAPVIIVPCYHKDEGFAPEYIPINMGIVAENLMLEADSLDLGTVFLGIDPEPERMAAAKELLDLPENQEVFCLIPVGYARKALGPDDKSDMSRVHYIQ